MSRMRMIMQMGMKCLVHETSSKAGDVDSDLKLWPWNSNHFCGGTSG